MPPQKIFKFRALEMPFQPFPQDVFSKLIRRKMQKLVVYIFLPISSIVRKVQCLWEKIACDAIRIIE